MQDRVNAKAMAKVIQTLARAWGVLCRLQHRGRGSMGSFAWLTEMSNFQEPFST